MGAFLVGGLVNDEQDPIATSHRELFPVESHHADLWMVKQHRRRSSIGDVVSCPEASEQFAGKGQLASELDHPRIIDVATDRPAESGGVRCRCPGPVNEECLLVGVQKDVA